MLATRWTMSDPVLGNAARWHSNSPLYGESLWREHLAYSGGPIIPTAHPAAMFGLDVARAYVVTLHGSVSLDAPRHDL